MRAMHRLRWHCLKAGKKKILAVDSSKFDKISFTKVGEFREVDMVVTDARPSQEWMQKFGAAWSRDYISTGID